ncbi:recombinase family protein [Ammoniphilus sp. CFH 90114]|uniref:recombinase family protein n=1 Tax=Ammoniphilus sp. CFH 90114 TaxID=2493665 RepID=UPI00100EE930|nr:recombinase family protein [Ammoniphilus sp. CFH 90114]RXT14884.1 recombinase family protein [Ammoniphilus sp. CFH 90114]
MIFGYARVSTHLQSLDSQIDALKKFGCMKIYEEKLSGKRKDRPELKELLKVLRKGDTVVVYKLDRISRSTKHLIELIDFFQEKEVNFVSLQENIDTTSSMGKFIFRIFAAVAEMERDIIVERTKEGLNAARARGRVGGRPKVSEEDIKTAITLYRSNNFTVQEIVKKTNVARSTLYKYLMVYK